ncbi:MAG: NifU family protein [Gemmatimonadales bacterium]
MTAQAEFERRMEVVEELVRTLETTADPGARSAAQELVKAVMDLNSAGLERMLQMAQRGGEAGRRLADQFAQDGLVASLLLLYGLHPVDLETRVRGALDKTRPYLKSHGGNVELVEVDETGTVRLRLQGSCHGCPSSAMTLKHAIEQAIHDAAPDVVAIVVEGEADPTRKPRPDEGTWEEVTEAGHVCSGGLRVLS